MAEFGNPFGNAGGNPLALMVKGGAGIKVQTGSQFGPTGSPSVSAIFPLKKINLNKAILFATFQGAGSSGANDTSSFSLTSLEEEMLTFFSGASPYSGYWPTVSWVILEIESIKRITRVAVNMPSSTTQNSAVTNFPDGTNPDKVIVVPVLYQSAIAAQSGVDATVNMTATDFRLTKGLFSTVQVGTKYMCQIVEFE